MPQPGRLWFDYDEVMDAASRRADRLALALLFLLPTLLFADVLFGGWCFYARDLFLYHYPLKSVVREVISSGHFPWWNRMLSGGQPMVANPAYEIFYPPQWLIFIGPFRFGFALHILIHLHLALLGAYLLLRSLSLRLEAAFFGAVSFAMSGFLPGTMSNLPTFFVWSWAPLIGWAMLRYARGRGRRDLLLAVSVTAMPLLVAEPVSLIQVWLLLAIGAALCKAWRPMLLVTVLAVAVASVQLLPMADHTRDSVRSRGFSYDTVTDFSMPPLRPVELIAPRALGGLTEDGHATWDPAFFTSRGVPYLVSLYCGVAVVLLALAGLLSRRRGAWITVGIGVLAWFLAIGGSTPFYRWLYDAGVRSLRYPEKWAAMGVVALVVFASFQLHGLLEGDLALKRSIPVAAALVIVALVFSAAVDHWGTTFHARPQTSWTASVAWLVAGALAVLWWIVLRKAPSQFRVVWSIVALVLLLVDLLPIASSISPRMPSSFFDPPPLAVRIRSRAPQTPLFNRADWYPRDTNLPAFRALSLPFTGRNALSQFAPLSWDIPTAFEFDIDETDLLPTHDVLDAMQRRGESGAKAWAEPFMTMAGVGVVLDPAPFAAEMTRVHGDPARMEPVRARAFRHDGRYWFAGSVAETRDIDDLLEAVAENPDVRGRAFVSRAGITAGHAVITSVQEDASTAAITFDATAPGLLVANVTRHKYWRSTIDGREIAAIPANLAYQAFMVPAGHHILRMRYRNPLVLWGALLSSLTLLLLAGRAMTPIHSPR